MPCSPRAWKASRAAWLVVDPNPRPRTHSARKTAAEGERQFAINQVKEKGVGGWNHVRAAGAQQGVLSAIGSKQNINFTDPMKADFLKFKAAGMTLS